MKYKVCLLSFLTVNMFTAIYCMVLDQKADSYLFKNELNLTLFHILDKSPELISKENLKVAIELIDQGADINLRNREGNTVLLLSVYKGYESIVKILIKNNADLDIKNNLGQTAQEIAVAKIHNLSDKDQKEIYFNINSLLINAIIIADQKLKKDVDQRAEEKSAIENFDKELIVLFFQESLRGFVNSYSDIFALYQDSFEKDWQQELMNIRCVCKKFNSVIQEYIKSLESLNKVKKERFEYLRDMIRSQNKLNQEELNLGLVKILEKLEATSNSSQQISQADLKEAVRLIISGADIKISNKYGNCGNATLIYATQSGYKEIVKTLIKLNINLENYIKDNDSETEILIKKETLTMARTVLLKCYDELSLSPEIFYEWDQLSL
ncbi:ankyrin repeat domain-containing protein [Candidatus Babela massiliensis]|uniref:Ankyrin repeats containing protein n=1 Tax=Candidatus Babela massiliensis TaxID=673862 RepID=V6DJL3_9BACT|nr:ankyrin repeat domain-containing protein [Candidatus Babela massiliensis]CDK31083.1 Ankyrin repeats containing protein [Candidatus Babela massiliensis]